MCIAAIGAPNDDIDGMDIAGIASPLSKNDFFPPGLFSPASGPRTSPPPDDVGAREGCARRGAAVRVPPVSAGSADAVSSDTVFASRATRRSRASLECSSFWGRATGPRTGRTARAGDGRGEPKAAETRRRRLSKTERLSQTDFPYARRRTRRGAATRPAGRAGRGRDAAPRPAARARAAQRVQRRALPPQRRGERLAGRRVYKWRVGVFVFVFFSFVSGGEDRAAGGDGRGDRATEPAR